MKTLISTFFLLYVLSGCQQASVVLEPPSTPQSTLQDLSEARKGREAALENIAQGRLMLIAYGRPHPIFFEYAKVLKERYGVIHSHRGCVLLESEAYLRAYESTMSAEITERFGDDVFDKARQEAEENWALNQS